ncbi:MAG: ABC transporter ATP-binding protein [Desulfurococcaceae archaeon]
MITIDHVSKSFGFIKALDNVSFTIRNGEIVGYVGLNGAGKTTTMKIAVGVLTPDSGDVFIDNYSITRNKRIASKYVGWVPEQPIFEMDMKALDYFTYLAGYYGLSISEARSIGRKLLEEVGLGNALNRKLKEYSLGMKRRFALAVSMINNPPNFLFDEAMSGLDPKGIAFFRELVVKLKKNNCAILFSSHILSEVENIADRVVFIHRGRIVADMTIDEIRSRAKPVLRIRIEPVNEELINILKSYGEPRVEKEYVYISRFTGDSNELLSYLIKNNYRVLEYGFSRLLEEVFFELIGEKK